MTRCCHIYAKWSKFGDSKIYPGFYQRRSFLSPKQSAISYKFSNNKSSGTITIENPCYDNPCKNGGICEKFEVNFQEPTFEESIYEEDASGDIDFEDTEGLYNFADLGSMPKNIHKKSTRSPSQSELREMKLHAKIGYKCRCKDEFVGINCESQVKLVTNRQITSETEVQKTFAITVNSKKEPDFANVFTESNEPQIAQATTKASTSGLIAAFFPVKTTQRMIFTAPSTGQIAGIRSEKTDKAKKTQSNKQETDLTDNQVQKKVVATKQAEADFLSW